MSLKGSIRRLEADMLWLKTEGTFRQIEAMIKILELKREITLRNPEFAEKWDLWSPDIPRPPVKPVREPFPAAEPPVRPVPGDAAVPAASEGEVKPVEDGEAVKLHPEAQSAGPRSEGCEPMPGMPTVPRPEHMQIRPVTWRIRGPDDYDSEDSGHREGKCLVDYDPLEDT